MTTASPREQLLAQANPFLPGPTVKPRPPEQAALASDEEFMDLDDRLKDVASIPLFKLDGHLYSIPADPPAGFALQFLSALKEGVTEDKAAAKMLTDLLGEEVYAAMATSPKVKISDFARVMEIVKARVLGPIMESLGK